MGRRVPTRRHVRACDRARRRRESAPPRRRCRDPDPEAPGNAARARRVARMLCGRAAGVSLDVHLLPAGWLWTAGRASDHTVLATQVLPLGGGMRAVLSAVATARSARSFA